MTVITPDNLAKRVLSVGTCRIVRLAIVGRTYVIENYQVIEDQERWLPVFTIAGPDAADCLKQAYAKLHEVNRLVFAAWQGDLAKKESPNGEPVTRDSHAAVISNTGGYH